MVEPPSSSRLLLVLAVALVVAAVCASGGTAAPSAPQVWPGIAIGYRDLTGAHGYHAAVRHAVTAWNRVGLGVRFVPAPAGQSMVQIVYSSGRCLSGVAGRAPIGFQRFGARVVLRSCPAIVRYLLVAHELGRVLGLGNNDDTCSLMNTKGASDGQTFAAPARCSRYAPPAWLPRLVDPLSAARARALYAAPQAALEVRFTPGANPRVDWRQPTGSSRRSVLLRTTGRCPARTDVLGHGGATVVYSEPSYAGRHWAVDTGLGSAPGSYCYRLFNISASGRPTPSVPFPFLVSAAPAPAAVVDSLAVADRPTAFADRSTGQIVHWHWDFGDFASGAANIVDTGDPNAGRTPSHTYAVPGSYTVSLTVIDEIGRSATTTIVVTVQ